MGKYGLVSLILFFLGLTVFFLQEVSPLKAQVRPYQPLEGPLFKGRIEALEKADVPLPLVPKNIPALSVFVKDPRQVGLAVGAREFFAKIVPESDAKVELAPMLKRPARSKARGQAEVKLVPKPVVSPEQEVASERLMTFSNLDAALNASDASFPLKNRFQKGGITLQLMQIGKWNGFYLLKYSLMNEEEREFFISSVQLAMGGAEVPSESFVPFSCLPRSSIMGIAKFPMDGMASKPLSFVLEESGGKYLKLEIKDVDYKF
jgi:hypothetical protein